VLARGDERVIFDWGDACFTHPFLSLAVTMRFAAERTGRGEDAPQILALRDAYLEAWSDVAPLSTLREAAEHGRRLGHVSGVLVWHVITRHYPEALDRYEGGLGRSLRRVAARVRA
jgi:Ser/Thr protein kinase RdoA (MazF antagonist)